MTDLAVTPYAPTERVKPLVPPSAPRRELQVFPNPAAGRDYAIQFQVPEFTCNCPLTGQPDFAHFTIDMVADRLCIELKSLKLYMWSYRQEGAFHEKVTNEILDDIVRATDPRFARISAKWYVRGGIYTNLVAEHRKRSEEEFVAEHRKPGWTPAPRVEMPMHAPATGMMA